MKIVEIGPTDLEIIWVTKAFFYLRTQTGLAFRFYELFLLSDEKQRVIYIIRNIYPAFLKNRSEKSSGNTQNRDVKMKSFSKFRL